MPSSLSTQTNLEAATAGGQRSAVRLRLAGCYQGVPDTSNCIQVCGCHILRLRHLSHFTAIFSPAFSSLKNLVSHYIISIYRCGWRRISGFPDVFFYPKLNKSIYRFYILANLCNKLKNFARNSLLNNFQNNQSRGTREWWSGVWFNWVLRPNKPSCEILK